MICSYCGKEIADDSMFCNYCGKEVDLTGKCPNCRRDVPDGSAFCPFCGNALMTPSIEDTIDENDQCYVYVCRQCKYVKFGYRNSKEICDYCYKPMVESAVAEEDWLRFDREKKANCLNLILTGKGCTEIVEEWKNTVFICPSCRKTWKSDDDAVIVRCPSCKAKLVNSFISGEKWDDYTSEEKEKVKTDVIYRFLNG